MKTISNKSNENFVVGLDCSTTSSKAIVFDRKGNVVAEARESIPLYSPKPNYYEQDPEDWWRSVRSALRKVSKEIDPQKIIALAISNQRETFVPLDKNGSALRPAIIWLDERCKDEVEPFARKIGRNKIHKITGKPVDYAPVVYRLAWMKKHEPKLFKQISMICDVHTYITWKLTGTFKTSIASADPLGLFDMKNKKWSPEILNALGLKTNQLPLTFIPGSVLGSVSDEASKNTGLNTNTLIIAGGGDGQSGGLGSNTLTSQRAYLNIGTAVVVGVYAKNYKTSKAYRTMSSCSESGYYYECSLRAGTFAVDWFVKNILKVNPLKQPAIYTQLEKEAEKVLPGSGGVLHLPYICGAMNPYWDVNARGAFIGLSSSHTRGHLYRSILEGIAFETLFEIDAVEKSIGTKVKDFIAIGGGTKSDLWLNILADVTGKNIYIPKTNEASALGAAITAAVGTGWFKTFKEAAGAMTGIKEVIKANKKNNIIYKQLFLNYRKIYPQIKSLQSN